MTIKDCAQVTPGWLTEKLTAVGALWKGTLATVVCDDQPYQQGWVSKLIRLEIEYSPEALGDLPPTLAMKFCQPDLHPELADRDRHEVAFYQAAQENMPDLPVPTCYEVAFGPATNQSHILMQDLSATHFQRPLPIPPSNEHCRMIVASLANLHARRWNDPQLGRGLGERLTMDRAAMMTERLWDTFPAFCDYFGDALLPSQRLVYERIMASNFLDDLSRRLCDLRDVTLVHGDAHTGNLMLPHDTEKGRVMLIDWHMWDINVAAIDLAFLMALHWPLSRRALLERPLLNHYYQELLAHGVEGLTWDDLWRDYRESVIIMTLIPIGQFRRGSPAGTVWFGLQDSLAAFEDLRCVELL